MKKKNTQACVNQNIPWYRNPNVDGRKKKNIEGKICLGCKGTSELIS